MTVVDGLTAIAAGQHGFVTVQDARDAGIDPRALRTLAAHRRAENRGRGIYRLNTIPGRPNDIYAEAVLLANRHGALGGEAALDMWDLADVNPRRVHVVVPPGVQIRRNRTDVVFRQRKLGPDDIDEVDDVRVLAVPAAIRMVTEDGTDGTLIEQAITAAQRRELIGTRTAARLLTALDDRQRGQRHGR